MSIDYLIRLEQGRDSRPSPAVLAALAKALHLTDDERTHMVRLVAHHVSAPLCPTNKTPSNVVAPTVVRMLDGLARTPAFVLGPQSDVLAWNESWARLAEPLGMLDGQPPNLARYVFLHPSAQSVYPDWAKAADEQASRLRAASARWFADPPFADLIAELAAASTAFALRWSAHDVTEKHRGLKRLVHPDAGELRLAFEVLLLPDEDDQRMVTWLAADAATELAIAGLLAGAQLVSPARLRIVGTG